MLTKVCTKCGEEKDKGLFRVQRNKCRACEREDLREYALKYYYKNHEKLLGSRRKYYLKHRELCLEKNRKWREKNPEMHRKWREKNKEYYQKYHQKNKEKINKASAEFTSKLSDAYIIIRLKKIGISESLIKEYPQIINQKKQLIKNLRKHESNKH